MTRPGSPSDPAHYKDKILDRLAREVNVAQFVSYAPDLEQRFARIRGSSADETPRILEQAAGALLEASVDRSLPASDDPFPNWPIPPDRVDELLRAKAFELMSDAERRR